MNTSADRPKKLLLMGVLVLFLGLDLYFLFTGQTLSFPGSTELFIVMGLALAAILLAVYLGGLLWPTWILLIVLSVGLFIAASHTGGVYSNSVLFFIPTTLIATGLLGRAAGLVWTLMFIGALWYMAFQGGPDVLAPPLNQARNISVAFVAVLLIVWWFQHSLRASAEALRKLNAELESQVRVRTEQVLVSEKLSTIGRLTAGLAHELNTPLAAIRSMAESGGHVVREWHGKDLEAFASLPESERSALARLISQCESAILHPPVPPSPLLLREWTKKCRGELTALGIETSLAHTLSDLGVVLYPQGLVGEVSLWTSPRVAIVVQLLEHSVTLFQSNRVLTTAVKKVSSVVQVLQNQSRTDFSYELQTVDLVEELEMALVLFQGKLRPPLLFLRDYQQHPVVLANPEAVGQIFINLLTNALQAMEYSGTLTVAVGTNNGEAWVEVTDSGPGIPPDTAAQIFTPFFTTKPAGQGNGLGLDISRRLSRSFGGNLDFTSVPGRTVFRLTLPSMNSTPRAGGPSSD